MARYIEANDLVRAMTLQANRTMLGEIAPPQLSYSEMLEIIADAPTADVVPKSDIVGEIFGEIEKYYCINKFGEVYVHFDSIEEIKKKYKGEA